MPGLTTRMVAGWVDKVLVCFPESAKYYKDQSKVEVVGMPVRREFIYTKKADARKELGLGEEPLVLSAYGSQGAKAMNEVTAQLFRLEKDGNYPFRHIHAVGSYGWSWMPDYIRQQGVDPENDPSITVQEYIYNMPTLMAAADVFISRAGASSCSEIAASGTPCILIPSPNVTNDHQTKNAKLLSDRGGAVLLPEGEEMGQKLYNEVTALLKDHQRRSEMSSALRQAVVINSAERICDMIEELAGKDS